jgi:hypothetical protein
MNEKEMIETVAEIAGVTVPTLRKKLISHGLNALLSDAERLSFSERFDSIATLDTPPLQARFVAQAYKEFQ